MVNNRHDIGKRTAGDKAILADEFISKAQLQVLSPLQIGIHGGQGLIDFDGYYVGGEFDIRYKNNIVIRFDNDLAKFKKHFVNLDEWQIPHNLNTYPTVELITDAGVRMYAYHENTDKNNTVVKFNIPTSGWAYCF